MKPLITIKWEDRPRERPSPATPPPAPPSPHGQLKSLLLGGTLALLLVTIGSAIYFHHQAARESRRADDLNGQLLRAEITVDYLRDTIEWLRIDSTLLKNSLNEHQADLRVLRDSIKEAGNEAPRSARPPAGPVYILPDNRPSPSEPPCPSSDLETLVLTGLIVFLFTSPFWHFRYLRNLRPSEFLRKYLKK